MAYLMVSYKAPSTYALIDLTEEEFGMVSRGLGELHDLYAGFGEAAEKDAAAVQALIDVLDRRYAED